MDNFINLTTLSFILAVVGLLVQVYDVFPRYREARRDVLLITFGFFVGSLISSLTGVSLSVDGSGLTLSLAFGFLIISSGFLLAGVATRSYSRKNERYAIAIVSLGLFLAFLIFPTLEAPVSSSERLTFAERLVLARHNTKAGLTDRAIHHLEWAHGMLPDGDQRAEILYREIKTLERRQFEKEFESINEANPPNADITTNQEVAPIPATSGGKEAREAAPTDDQENRSSQEAAPVPGDKE